MGKTYDEIVEGRLYIGGADEAEKVVRKGKANIVFDVRVNPNPDEVEYNYVHTPITEEHTAQAIVDGAKKIKAAYDEGKKIYIHCGSGTGRAAVMTVAVLQEISLAGSVEDAEIQVKMMRPTIDISPKMREALKENYK